MQTLSKSYESSPIVARKEKDNCNFKQENAEEYIKNVYSGMLNVLVP
jgi:hypothetical protein